MIPFFRKYRMNALETRRHEYHDNETKLFCFANSQTKKSS